MIKTMIAAEIQHLIDQSTEPRIEIGGPTPEGYTFLSAVGLHLPEYYTVTNIANPITLNPFGNTAKQYPVDEVIDIRTLPYPANSIGLLLTSSLPLYGAHAQHDKQTALAEYKSEQALHIALSKLHNLHIVLLRQAMRSLRPGGILIMENTWPQDTEVAQKLAFIPLLAATTEQQVAAQIYAKP